MTCLAASPDSKWIATGSGDGTIIVWDAESGTIIHEWLAHWGRVEDLNFSPHTASGPQRLVSAGGYSSGGETLVVWELDRDEVSKVAVLASIDAEKVRETFVDTCVWSPDGTLIAAACQAGPVRVWDAVTFQQLASLLPGADNLEPRPMHDIRSLQWSSDSCYLAWRYRTSKGCNLDSDCDEWAIWSPLTEETPRRLPSHPIHPKAYALNALSFNPRPRSRHIATAIARKHPMAGAEGSECSSVSDVQSYAHSGYVLIWDIVSGATLNVLVHARGVRNVSFSPDGRSLLSLSEDGSVQIWDSESWQETTSLEGSGDGGTSWSACLSPNGKYVAVASNNYETNTYTVQLRRTCPETLCAAVFQEHREWICHLAFSPDGECLVSGDAEGLVRIRRVSDLQET